MIEMLVSGIALDVRSGLPLVILNDKENKCTLPIWIGHAEAQAIARALEDIKTERPMTHDLMVGLLDTLEADIDSVEIHSFENSTFFASIIMTDRDENTITIDARPSDAISIALRVDCPVYVSEDILYSDTSDHKDIIVKEDQDFEAFQQFLKDVKASDFTLKGKDKD